VAGKFGERAVQALRPGDIAGMGEPGRPPALPPAALPPVAEPDEMYPRPGDAYHAHARPSNKPESMVCFLMRSSPAFMVFSYANLDTIMPVIDGPGGVPTVVIRFTGTVVRDVRLEGRNLMPVVAYLQQHRVHWVRELPTEQDFHDRKAPAVTRITVTEVSR
jgi:hypothetical protein